MAKRKAGASAHHSPRKRAGRPKKKFKDRPGDDGNKKDDGEASPARRMTRSMSVRDGAEELLLGLGCGVVDEGTSTTATIARQLDSAHITARQDEDSHSETLAPPIQTTPEPTLAGRIQGLAQELQDLILDFTLIAGVEGGKMILDRHYLPPWQLGINARSRRVVAPTYYKSTRFQADKLGYSYLAPPTRVFLRKWLLSLRAEDLASIREIRLPDSALGDISYLPPKVALREHAKAHRQLEVERLRIRGPGGSMLLGNNVLRVRQEIRVGATIYTVSLNDTDCVTRMARYREMLSRS